jgi:moderate conductance mechanosensitive channel
METEMEPTALQSTTISAHIGHALAVLVERFATWLFTSGARIVIVLVLAWIALRLLSSATTRLHGALVGTAGSLERTKRADTILGMVRTTASILIGTAAGMMVLRETGIDVAPVLATAGIGGLAIGFGAQTLVKDVISGFFLLVEDQVRIGDVVEVAGRRGTVETIQLRTIRLRDLSGNLHVVPNGSITLVSNMTRDFSRYLVDAQVARREDPDRVFAALRQIGDEMQLDPEFKEDILQPIEILGVETLTAANMMIRARLTTRAVQQWRVGREFNRRMKKRFDELGISAA